MSGGQSFGLIYLKKSWLNFCSNLANFRGSSKAFFCSLINSKFEEFHRNSRSLSCLKNQLLRGRAASLFWFSFFSDGGAAASGAPMISPTGFERTQQRLHWTLPKLGTPEQGQRSLRFDASDDLAVVASS